MQFLLSLCFCTTHLVISLTLKTSACIKIDPQPCLLPIPTAPSGQDERVYDQTRLPVAHPHPARPRHPQTAVLDPQDCPLPSAALAAQMPQGNDPDMTPHTRSFLVRELKRSVDR